MKSWASIAELAKGVRSKRLRAVDLVGRSLSRIEKVDSSTRAFVRTFPGAIEAADRIDRQVDNGDDPGPLAGVPVALKDNLAFAGQPVTCGSRILEGYVSPFTGTAVERLVAAGAVPVGHTNMDEFGMGSSCENSSFFSTTNPWDLERVPGGSSGGSAAAVAAKYVPLALGTDTGGSIRQPAALCGVVGLKPSYGRISRYGLVAFASSLDQIGPISQSVEDATLVLEVMAGADPRDATCARRPEATFHRDVSGESTGGVEGTRIGVVRQFEEVEKIAGLAPCVRKNWQETVEKLAADGAEIVEVDLPSVHAAIATYYVLANSEASANLARFDGIRYGQRAETRSLDDLYRESRSAGFGAEVKRRILLGTFALSSGYYDAYYGKAEAAAAQLGWEIERALTSCDVLATPTSPTSAFLLGSRTEDPLSMYLSDVFTTPASLAGLPAIAVPSGLDACGLPLSVQFIGGPFREDDILRCGTYLERRVGRLEPNGFGEEFD